MKKLVIVFAVIILVLLGILLWYNPAKGPETPAAVKGLSPAPNPPALAPEPQPAAAKNDIKVALPQLNEIVKSPVIVSGDARGTWFFEASFPIKILDADGRVLGKGPATAQGDWMTTGTVPFIATIPFTAPKYATGTVALFNDNPSELPGNAKSISVPVCFSAPQLPLPSLCHKESD